MLELKGKIPVRIVVIDNLYVPIFGNGIWHEKVLKQKGEKFCGDKPAIKSEMTSSEKKKPFSNLMWKC